MLKPIQFLLQYWPSRSFKLNDFHVTWKPISAFLLVINSNLGCISHHFWDRATYSFKHSIQNCSQTAADGHMVSGYCWQPIWWYHRRSTTTYRLAIILHDWNCIVLYHPSRSSKVSDSHLIWHGVCDFLLVIIISNLCCISNSFRGIASFPLKNAHFPYLPSFNP